MSSDPRREYLVKFGVESAVTAAITKVLEKQPATPLPEVGKCLLDSAYVVPSGAAMAPVLEYVAAHGVKTAVSEAIKTVAAAMPADPILAIGRKLAAGGSAPVSEYMAYWAPSTYTSSALATEKEYHESLKMPLGKRCMMEREARGLLDASVPQSEYIAYWAPTVFEHSALPNKKAFEATASLPWGKRCMIEREARGFLELDTAPKPQSEYDAYWSPREFKDSALQTEKIFMESLKEPAGKRAMLEREARRIVDPDTFPKSEFEAYWAPTKFEGSALTKADYEKSVMLPFGKRMMLERDARGMLDPGVKLSEYMEYFAPRTPDASALTKKEFAASKAMPWGQRCMLERAARGYDEYDETPKPRSEYLAYWSPTSAAKSAIKDKAAFAASLKLPCGARAVMEREARGVVLIA